MSVGVSVARRRWTLGGDWSFRRVGEEAWLPAQVPGSNFTDLWRAGVIEDPYAGDAEDRLQWIEQADWEYRCRFDLDADALAGDSVELAFDGLDTFCTVTLNGAPLIETDNMFREWRAEASTSLRAGSNELLLRFRSPVASGTARQAADGFLYPAENDKTPAHASVYARKAPYHFGWDWGPKYVTSGVWRPVWLDAAARARVRDVNWRIDALDDRRALVVFTVEVDSLVEGAAMIDLTCPVDGVVQARAMVDLGSGLTTREVTVAIDRPRRWWPNGLGDAFLYPFAITLSDAEGNAIDRADRRVGLRTVRVVNEPDAIGESFFVEVNGRPVFMKGANYIPPDSFIERVTPARYRQLFRDTVDANMNMLRVWGGGVYESDLFYDLADEHGVLIWQDFMFACTLYPFDPAFLDNVAAEAADAIRRLRHHPSLALWCGNNEIELGVADWEWPEKFGYSAEQYRTLVEGNRRIFDDLLAAQVERHDPDRFYFASSPIGFWSDPADDARGDNHYWGVWHGELPFASYADRVPRFMSEYGFQSYPLASSIARFVPAGERRVGSPALAVHQKHPRGDAIIGRFVRETYGEPSDFDAFCYLSQLCQADGLKVAFEAHRRAMPRCMGSLYWQINDCWPAISWSSIDYYGQWKALHHQAARSFAPLLLSVDVDGAARACRIHGVSDRMDDLAGELAVDLIDFDGNVLWTASTAAELGANTARVLAEFPLPDDRPAGSALTARFRVGAEVLVRATALVSDEQAHGLPDPALTIESIGDSAVRVTASRFARGVHLSAERSGGQGESVNFADNFFDLLPGEAHVVAARGGAFDPATLSVRSLFDACLRSTPSQIHEDVHVVSAKR